MPQLGGRQLAELLQGERPDMKILYVSGYTDDEIVRHGILHSEVNFLQKPFTPAALAAKLRWTLNPRGAASLASAPAYAIAPLASPA
jgi:YesN/AraC family two-component response regulator